MKAPPTGFVFPVLSPWIIGLILFSLFCFRLAYGLCSEFWADEEKETYIIGLKYFTTGQWPYFGATAFLSQIPGSLQGLSIGLPLFIWPAPESPFFLLNLVSFCGLCLLAWYLCRRIPQVPAWFIWGWLMTAPWTLNFSTHIVNPSYVLVGGCLFFVGFFETLPGLRMGILPVFARGALMGFAFFWIIQFHLSGAVLAPLILLAWVLQWQARPSKLPLLMLGMAAGALPALGFLVPTYLHFGLAKGSGGTSSLLHLNLENLSDVFTVLARFLSFASFEIPRFLGPNTAERLDFFNRQPWLWPAGILLLLAGWAQVLWMVFRFFNREKQAAGWNAARWLTLGSILYVAVSFWFTSKSPAAHTYYVFLPVAMLYFFYSLGDWMSKKSVRFAAAVFLGLGIIYHTGLALDRLPTQSLYKNRPLILSAIQQKNYHLFGEKYSDSW